MKENQNTDKTEANYQDLQLRIKELEKRNAELESAQAAAGNRLRYLEQMEAMDRVIQHGTNLETALHTILEAAQSIFRSDRAWLLYPCDPEADSWHVPMEVSRPEYPGVFLTHNTVAMTRDVREGFAELLAADGPVTYDIDPREPLWDPDNRFAVRSTLSMALFPKTGKPWNFGLHQCAYQRKWTEEEKHLFKAIGQRITEVLSSMLLMQSLAESEGKYRHLFETAMIGIYRTRIEDGKFIVANQALAKMLGYESVDRLVEEYVTSEHYSDPKRRKELLNQLQSHGKVDGFEIEMMRADGSAIQIALSATAYPGEGYLEGVIVDITERKQAEEALRESEKKYRLIAENVDDVIWKSDLAFNWIYISPSFIKLTGYSSEEAVKMPLQEMITPDSAETAAIILMEELGKLKGPQSNDIVRKIEVEFCCKDGSTVWAEINVKIQMDSDGNPAALLGVTRDISDRKRAEALILESEAKYRSIFENAIEGFFQSTPEGRFINVNPAFARMHGYATPEELTAAISDISTQHYVNPEDREGYQQRLRENGYVENFEFKARRKDGSHIWVSSFSRAIYDQNGTLVRYEGNMHDITERKQAESEVMREKRFSEMVINQLPGSFYMFNEEGRFLRWNDNLETVTGYSSAEIQEMQALDFFNNDEKEDIYRKIQEGFIKGTSQVEANFLTKDGRKIPHYLTGSRIESGGVIYLLGIGLDMTERREIEIALKESEEKLVRSKKMESMGLLAGGVAHDLNNILSGIVSYPELLLIDLPEDSKLRAPIETMRESGNRAVAIVQDLLTVARGVATTKEPLNVNDLVNDYFHSPEFRKLKQFSPAIRTRTSLETDLLNIEGSDVHIRKVLMNLVSNAAEAINNRGIVSVATANRFIDRPLKGYDDVKKGEYVVLAVSDDGSGIPPDDLASIFEPFYTKKVMGRSGTGLGLAVVWNTVQDHKGYIDVTSNKSGTTFELYFPITRAEKPGKDLPIPIKEYKGNGETILVIDDMKSQREISCKMLDSLGYKTRSVSSGEEAVEYLQNHTVDILLLDMIMDPGMNGRKTYEQIIEMHPNQKVIITSGYAETEDVKAVQKFGSGRYVKKPLTLEKIGLAVKAELEK